MNLREDDLLNKGDMMNNRFFGMTFKGVFRRKTRSLLTILSIIVGIMLVTALLMVANGLNTQFQQLSGGSGADFVVLDHSSDLSSSRVNASIETDLEKMDGISWVSGMVISTTNIGDRPFAFVMGVNPGEKSVEQFRIVEGRTLQSGDTGKVIIGRVMATQEGLKIGDTLNIKDKSFEVVGIYETGVTTEDGGVVVPLGEAQSLFDLGDQVSMLQVKVENIDRVDAIRTQIENRYPQLLALKGSEVANQQADLQLINSISSLIALIAILVGSIVVMNTMIMSVMERTREIGVLRAIGWKRRKILSLILKESFTISIIGGVIGIVLGIVMVNLLTNLAKISLNLPVTLDLVVGVFLITIILGILGGFYPAWRASKMSPMEALSRE
jgi:putative ABC transport system permease protein